MKFTMYCRLCSWLQTAYINHCRSHFGYWVCLLTWHSCILLYLKKNFLKKSITTRFIQTHGHIMARGVLVTCLCWKNWNDSVSGWLFRKNHVHQTIACNLCNKWFSIFKIKFVAIIIMWICQMVVHLTECSGSLGFG